MSDHYSFACTWTATTSDVRWSHFVSHLSHANTLNNAHTLYMYCTFTYSIFCTAGQLLTSFSHFINSFRYTCTVCGTCTFPTVYLRCGGGSCLWGVDFCLLFNSSFQYNSCKSFPTKHTHTHTCQMKITFSVFLPSLRYAFKTVCVNE